MSKNGTNMNRRGFLGGLAALGVTLAFTKEASAAPVDVSDTTGQVYEPNLRGTHPKYGARLFDGSKPLYATTDCNKVGEVFLHKGVDPRTGKPLTVINVIATTNQEHASGKVINIRPGTATVVDGQWTHTNSDQNLSRFIAKGLIDPNSKVVTNNRNDQHCPVVSRSSNPTTPGQPQPPTEPPPPPPPAPPPTGFCDPSC